MTTKRVQGLDGLAKALARDLSKSFERRIVAAASKAATETAHHIVQNMPIAFGELRASVHVDRGANAQGKIRVIADAPHAAAVENGSRPHWVPLQPLIDWVKLRGMQGLRKGRLPGTTSRAQADRVATSFQHQVREANAASLTGEHADVDAPMSIAKAIQLAIAKRGTKPHHFMQGALPFARKALDARVKEALGQTGSFGDSNGLGGG